MNIGDKVYYNKGIDKLDIGEGIISYWCKDGDRIRLSVDGYTNNGMTSCICDAVLGYTFFLSESDLRKHYGETERKRRNLDFIRKSNLVQHLKNKFPDIITDDIALYIFSLPNDDTEIVGEIIANDLHRQCSICGQDLSGIIGSTNYCPNCGTKLNGTFASCNPHINISHEDYKLSSGETIVVRFKYGEIGHDYFELILEGLMNVFGKNFIMIPDDISMDKVPKDEIPEVAQIIIDDLSRFANKKQVAKTE